MPDIDSKILIGVFGLIAGVWGWLLKHCSNSRKHPCADNLVFKDVCRSERKRIDDCMESEIEERKERYKELKEDINNRFDRLEELIKNNR